MSLKIALCTISANNFISYGLDCLYSSKKYNNYDFFYLIADEYREELYRKYINDITFINLNKLKIDSKELETMKFKYNVVEFNTSVKPAFYKYLFELGYDAVIYMDPDMECYSNYNVLENDLNNYSIILTPHKNSPEVNPFLKEVDFLNNGIYNLGFIAMKNCKETMLFLDWWDKSLRDNCYIDYAYGMATDQIWANFIPLYFDSVKIEKNPGMNLAFWNMHEREIKIKNSEIFINNEKLLFIHYSSLSINCKDSFLQKLYLLQPCFRDIYLKHIECVKSFDYNLFSVIPYKYNFYDNGHFISEEEKKFYGYCKLWNKEYKNPFSCTKGSFYYDFYKNRIKTNSFKEAAWCRKMRFLIKVLGLKKMLRLVKILPKINITHLSKLYD